MPNSGYLKPIALIFLCPFIIPLCWILGGWNPDFLLFRGDGIMNLPWYQKILQYGANWELLAYNPYVLGGATFIDVWERLPFLGYFSWFSHDPVYAQYGLILLLQLSVAYCGWSLCRSICKLQGVELQQTLLILLLFAFLPAILTRYIEGHYNLALGLLFCAIPLTLFFELKSGRISSLSILMAFLVWPNSLLSSGHQLKVYGIIVSFPLIWLTVSQTLSEPRCRKPAIWLLFFFIAMFAWCFDDLWSLLSYAQSEDSTRSIIGNSTEALETSVFSLDIWTYLSLLTTDMSFFSGRHPFPHELFFPVGALGLSVVYALFSRHRYETSLLLTCLIGLSLPLLLDNTKLPIFEAFRIPQRSLILFAFYGSVLGIVQTMRLPSQTSWSIVSFSSVLLFFALAPAFRPIWVAVVFIAGFSKWNLLAPLRFGSGIVILALVYCHVTSMSTYRQNVVHHESFITRQKAAAERYQLQQADLKNPLNRVQFVRLQSQMGVNTASAIELSSLDGYWQPTSRFLKTVQQAWQRPLGRNSNHFRFEPDSAGYNPLSSLYNFRTASVDRNGNLQWNDEREWQPAWISSKMTGNELQLLEKQNLFDSQYVTKEKVRAPGDCSEGNIEILEVSAYRVLFQANNIRNCPVTLSMNYVSTMRGRNDSGGTFAVYPAYRTLTGAWITEPGAYSIHFSPRSNFQIISRLGLLAILTLLGVGLLNRYGFFFSQTFRGRL